MQSEESIKIIERFFEALDHIIERGEIRGVKTYCDFYNIDRWNLNKQRKNPERGWFEVRWLAPLVRYYHISPRWLLTGQGKMTTLRGSYSPRSSD